MNSIIIPPSIDNKMRVFYVEKVSYNPRSRKLIQETIILEPKTGGIYSRKKPIPNDFLINNY